MLPEGGISPATLARHRQALGAPERQLGVLPTPRKVLKVGRTVAVNEVAVLLPADEGGRHAAEGLRALLRAFGVPRVPVVASLEAASRYAVLIAAGDPSSDSRIGRCWELCGERRIPLAQLGPQGYGLVSARRDGRRLVVLAAPGREGLRHGFATLRQLIVQRGGKPALREVCLADYPSFAVRGVIEGFHGAPWGHQQRLRMLDFCELYKLNTYICAPKDDPLHRERWREAHTGRRLRELRQLAEAAAQREIRFCFAISPGGSFRYASRVDFRALCRKLDSLRAVGVTSFALCFDDAPPELSRADRAAFSSLAAAHADVANRVRDHLDHGAPGATLMLCPAEGSPAYLKTLGARLSKDVLVLGTGEQERAPTINGEDADRVSEALGRPPLIWDNYPVNDDSRDRLCLGPLRGRAGDLGARVAGFVANPMHEGEASMLPLATVADYLWNAEAYRPEPSWTAALLRAGAKVYTTLRYFAESSMGSFLYAKDCPDLATALAAFWKERAAGAPGAAADELRRHFARMRRLKPELSSRLGNRWFIEEVGPYLDKLTLYGRAGAACLRMLASGSAATRRAVERLAHAVEADPRQVCGAVMDNFISRAMREYDAALGATSSPSAGGKL